MLADTLYGSDANHQTAKVADVELIAPTHKGIESKPLTEFLFNDKDHVAFYLAGHTPAQVSTRREPTATVQRLIPIFVRDASM